MTKSLALVLLSILYVAAQVHNEFLNLSMTPSVYEACGSHVTSEITLDCHITAGIGKVYSMEIGTRRGTAGVRHIPIYRLDGNNTLTFYDSNHDIHMNPGERNLTIGRMTFTVVNLDKSAYYFYCTASYLYHNAIAYSQADAHSTEFDYSGNVPTCYKPGVLAAVQGSVQTNHTFADKCPNGQQDRPEAFVTEHCASSDIKDWKAGPKVMDICCMIPSYTPVATFTFGLFMQRTHGDSGIFIRCIPDGFSMAFQRCGDAPTIVNVTRTHGTVYEANPDNYHVMVHADSDIIKNPVMDICCMIQSYTPVATFTFGLFMQRTHGDSGIFIRCIPDGFSMAFQRCGDAPTIVNVTRTHGMVYEANPDNYHVMVHADSDIFKNPVIG